MSEFVFHKENVLPATDPKSPFYVNLPSHDSKPIDNLVSFFKYWKYFIKSLIHYFKEIALVKEFEANINYQLLSSIQFPGFKDLPRKVINEISSSQLQKEASGAPKATQSNNTITPSTPSKDKSLPQSATPVKSEAKRPSLLKTKSNNSTFLKHNNKENANTHKRTSSTASKTSSSPVGSCSHATNDVKIPSNYFPDDALFTNLPPLFLNHHQLKFQTGNKIHKDLTTKIIPRLEVILKNLSSKIKEIKSSLKNESFANYTLAKEISETGVVLSEYRSSIERYSNKVPVLKKSLLSNDDKVEEIDDDDGVMDDPFLIKLRVDYQVKHQLIHENYMFASYVNLQNISKELFTYIMKELTLVIDKFGKLEFNPDFHSFLKDKISTSASKDWEHFISMNPNFLNIYKDTPVHSKKETRTFKTITLPYENSIHNKCIRFGVLYKKSKLLKKYNRCFYVLTCNYLHEFKIESDDGEGKTVSIANIGSKKEKGSKDKIGGFIGPNDVPVKSYNLNDCSIKIKDEKSLKFQLIKTSNNSKKYTFKCSSNADFNNWYVDLEELFKSGSEHFKRFALLKAKIEAKEQEHKRVKESKKAENSSAQDSLKTPGGKASNGIKNNFKLSFTNEESLSGIFTPTIKTPNPASPEDGNPFDSTFLNGISQHSNMSSNTVGSSASNYLASPTWSPNDCGSSTKQETTASHQDQHQTYLQMQQQILKQQEALLAQKLHGSQHASPSTEKDNQLGHSRGPSEVSITLTNGSISNIANFNSGISPGTPPPMNETPPAVNTLKNLSPVSSHESVHSFDIQTKGIQETLNKGQQTPSGNIPEFLVSSNH